MPEMMPDREITVAACGRCFTEIGKLRAERNELREALLEACREEATSEAEAGAMASSYMRQAREKILAALSAEPEYEAGADYDPHHLR